MTRLFKIVLPILLLPGIILAVGCSAKAPEPAPAPAPMPESALPLPPGLPGTDSQAGRGVTVSNEGVDRKIIKTGYLTLEVQDIVTAMDEVTGLAKDLDGYVVSSRIRERDDEITGEIRIRVPAGRFDEAFNELRQLATNVPDERTESQDVTEEYTDLKARLRNLEATENQYLELLEKAETVEDILKVRRELSNVRGEIEQIKGRIQYLERTSDMALIEVDLREIKSLRQKGWSASETLLSAVRGLITFAKVLVDVAIWLLIFCPIWIPVVIFIVRRRRRSVKA